MRSARICGISLQPVAVPTREDEFASTIMMPTPAGPSELPEICAARKAPVIDAVEVPDPETENEQAQADRRTTCN